MGWDHIAPSARRLHRRKRGYGRRERGCREEVRRKTAVGGGGEEDRTEELTSTATLSDSKRVVDTCELPARAKKQGKVA